MPLPIPAIGLGLDLATSIINPVIQNAQNQRNREFTKEMYARQRADALSDWERQNSYNSPAQQMQRLKEAGLNPNLVYGNGATATAGDVRGTSASISPGKAPEIDSSAMEGILKYQNFKQQELNQDRTAQAMEIGDIQKELLQAQVVKTLADAASTETNTGMKISLFPTNLELAQKRLEEMQAGNALKWQKLEQTEKMFPYQIASAIVSNNLKGEQIQTQQKVRQKMAQDIAASITNQSMTELKKISENQKQVLFDSIMESQLIKNQLDYNKLPLQQQQQEINRIRIAARGAGLSDQATENIIKAVIQAIGVSKLLDKYPRVIR